MLLQSGMDKKYWSLAVQCAAYLLNRSPSQENSKIPTKLWYEKPVDLLKLHAFDSVNDSLIPKEKHKKFESLSYW